MEIAWNRTDQNSCTIDVLVGSLPCGFQFDGYIYNCGTYYEDYFFDATSQGFSTFQRNADNIYMANSTASGGAHCLIQTNKKFDLTKYSKLKIEILSSYVPNADNQLGTKIMIGSNKIGTSSWNVTTNDVAYSTIYSYSTPTVVSLDVSAYSGEYYIGIIAAAGANAGCNVKFDKVWLE